MKIVVFRYFKTESLDNFQSNLFNYLKFNYINLGSYF